MPENWYHKALDDCEILSKLEASNLSTGIYVEDVCGNLYIRLYGACFVDFLPLIERANSLPASTRIYLLENTNLPSLFLYTYPCVIPGPS